MNLLSTASLGLFLIWSSNASAITTVYNYSFECGTNNSVANCNQSEAYLNLAVEGDDPDGTNASFTLTNIGPLTSHLKKVWIDDDAGILDILSSTRTQSSGVNFENISASSRNIGGLGFVAEGEARKIGNTANGVTSGIVGEQEWLTYDFDLGGANTFSMLIAALDAGTFRIGVHVGSYLGGGSEKLSTIPPVPLPAAFWLFGTALIGFIGISRRTKV